jgi:hypothetical protein
LVNIDDKDSVYLNLKAAIVSNNIVDIPVFIESDDQIFSLDFEMTFNNEKLEYLSIIDHTGYIQYNAFQNPNDKKLRFTSNHTSSYNISQKIVSIRFKLKAQCINQNDFIKINNFLNGDLCSLKLLPETICGTSSTNETESNVFTIPYPISNDISIKIPAQSVVSIYSIEGVLKYQFNNYITYENTVELPTGSLCNGVYIISLIRNQSVKSQIVVVQNN